MLDHTLEDKRNLVRSNKGSGLKLKTMLNLKLKECHFPGEIKLILPLWRNQVRTR
jgi:hypothetical protein